MSLLREILAHKRFELATAPEVQITRAKSTVRNVVAALERSPGRPLRLIAEVKLKSPSAGALSTVLAPAQRAEAYVRAGAALVSVLTDARYFGGSLRDLAQVRGKVPVPVLCKDFIVDERQLVAAFEAGADAVLLIVRCLDEPRLRALMSKTRALGMTPLAEVMTEAELECALRAEARVIGVNARDLDTLEMDLDRAHRVLEYIPKGLVAIHLSGVANAKQVAALAASRCDAVLVGQVLMRQDDPEPLLRALTGAAEGCA